VGSNSEIDDTARGSCFGASAYAKPTSTTTFWPAMASTEPSAQGTDIPLKGRPIRPLPTRAKRQTMPSFKLVDPLDARRSHLFCSHFPFGGMRRGRCDHHGRPQESVWLKSLVIIGKRTFADPMIFTKQCAQYGETNSPKV
jgi:hypothetical protein